jgi:hypothetical protein
MCVSTHIALVCRVSTAAAERRAERSRWDGDGDGDGDNGDGDDVGRARR